MDKLADYAEELFFIAPDPEFGVDEQVYLAGGRPLLVRLADLKYIFDTGSQQEPVSFYILRPGKFEKI